MPLSRGTVNHAGASDINRVESGGAARWKTCHASPTLRLAELLAAQDLAHLNCLIVVASGQECEQVRSIPWRVVRVEV